MSDFNQQFAAVFEQFGAIVNFWNANTADYTARTLRTVAEIKLLNLVNPLDLVDRLEVCNADHGRDMEEYALRAEAVLDAFEQRLEAMRQGFNFALAAIGQQPHIDKIDLVSSREALQALRENLRMIGDATEASIQAAEAGGKVDPKRAGSLKMMTTTNRAIADQYLLANAFLERAINQIDELLGK